MSEIVEAARRGALLRTDSEAARARGVSAATSQAVPFPGLVVLAALAISAPSGPALAQGESSPGPRHEVRWLPSGHLYDQYLADPRRVSFGPQVLYYPKTAIPGAGDRRFDLKAGAELVLARILPRGREDRGFEAALQAAFHGQFDIEHQLDNLGWDGWYGFIVAAAPVAQLSFRLGWLHDSSHVGDEYAERTGRTRIGYTRQEWIVGASWLTARGLRVYGELGYAGQMSNEELQEPARVQAGLEWHPGKRADGSPRGWYGAVDLSSMEERDWKVDTSVQAGYRLDSANKIWRFGIDWNHGRPPIGEFFQHTEQYVGFGMWVDF